MQLQVYQYKKIPYIQITDGRTPHTSEEYADGWVLREEIEATQAGISGIATVHISNVLSKIESQGYVPLWKYEIRSEWQAKFVR